MFKTIANNCFISYKEKFQKKRNIRSLFLKPVIKRLESFLRPFFSNRPRPSDFFTRTPTQMFLRSLRQVAPKFQPQF